MNYFKITGFENREQFKRNWWQYELIAEKYNEAKEIHDLLDDLIYTLNETNYNEVIKEIDKTFGDDIMGEQFENWLDYYELDPDSIDTKLEYLRNSLWDLKETYETIDDTTYTKLEEAYYNIDRKLENIIDIIELFEGIYYTFSASSKTESTYLTFNLEDFNKVCDLIQTSKHVRREDVGFEINKHYEELIEDEHTDFTLRISYHTAGGSFSPDYGYRSYNEGELSIIFYD